MTPIPDIAAVPWYTCEEVYQAFRSDAVDADNFFDTFEEWSNVAMEHERMAGEKGIILIRIRMSLEVFSKWCHDNPDFQNDGQGRSVFAHRRALEIVGAG